MPSSAVQNPPAQTESKSAKKKKAAAAAAARTESPGPCASPAPDKSVSGEDTSESPYVRELQKNIRNLNKKISNAAKTSVVLEQHKGKDLDDLVAAKIINADQKSQMLKKPQLEAQVRQLEEQLAQYRKIDDEYRARGAADKAKIEKDLTEKLEKEKADALAVATEKAAAGIKTVQHDSLLVLSQFLRLAAARRSEDADPSADENMALEGVLLNVYSGDENAVATMMKLIDGSDEKTRSVAGDELQTTFAQVKVASMAHVQALAPVEEPAPEVSEAPAKPADAPVTDPTVAHAGLTEIDTTVPQINGHGEPSSGVPNASVADDAANAAAESQWDNTNEAAASPDDWVKVPRDPTETETGLSATPAAAGPVQSWADDQPETELTSEAAATQADDGFHQVQRNRTRGQNESGGFRGRGRGGRGDFRGRRGDGRGRGQGRGGNPRGGRRNGGDS